MKKLLICTIVRDSINNLQTWLDQIIKLSHVINGHYSVYLSVYENDSIDGSSQALQGLSNLNINIEKIIITEKLGTKKYPSIWNLERIQNLANARQKCLDYADQKWGLEIFDKIAYIEPDVTFDVNWCHELVLAKHPNLVGLGEPDIYSGWSLRTIDHPKESVYLYDTCATRQNLNDNCWNFEQVSTWTTNSLIKTFIDKYNANCLHSLWSTFNCFCVYNAKPFLEGVKWGFVNKRLDTGQQKINDGWLDADTVVICEDFRLKGYNKIFINTNCLIRHI